METPEAGKQTTTPEHQNIGTKIVDIYLQRHGERGPDGWLTDKGVEQVRSETTQLAEQYLAPDSPAVTFFILNSPSATFIEGQPAGRRAEHSGRISAEAIQNTISEHGLSSNRAQLHEFGRTEAGTRANKRLSEPDYYYVEGADNSTGYFDALIETLGKEGREEGFFNSTEELEDLRKAVGAESSPDVAERTLKLIRAIDRYSKAYQGKYPNRKLVFLLESHGDVIRSTVQHGLGVEASKGWQPQTGQAVRLELDAGELSMDYNGMNYDMELRPKR